MQLCSVSSLLVVSLVNNPIRAFHPLVASSSRRLSMLRSAPPDAILEELQEQGFSRGLADMLIMGATVFKQRFWILDNSGSMSTTDGNRLAVAGSGPVQQIPCTRWKELQETVVIHSQIAATLKTPTDFFFLNKPGVFSGGSFAVQDPKSAARARTIMQNAEPMGVTPLAKRVREVSKKIRGMLPDLEASGQKVSLVIATDGLPTDDSGYGGTDANQELGKALQELQGLPVWVVIRLCTDDATVVDFYNDLDSSLELSMDVLDDFMGEAKEVQTANRWLNYALPVHRLREHGCYSRLFDLMDERKFTKDELRDYCILVFGQEAMDGLPDPSTDWGSFTKSVALLNSKDPQWNPARKIVGPMVDVGKF